MCAIRRVVAAVLVPWAIVSMAACGGDAAPSRPALALSMASPVEGRADICGSCSDVPATVVVETSVAVSDPSGPGGVVEALTTIVMNRSRALEVARNVRPNADFAFPATNVPAGGRLTLEAGVVAPLPPPRDEMAVTVHVRLTDGREASATAPLHVVFPAP
jgi:hypothetical protein